MDPNFLFFTSDFSIKKESIDRFFEKVIQEFTDAVGKDSLIKSLAMFNLEIKETSTFLNQKDKTMGNITNYTLIYAQKFVIAYAVEIKTPQHISLSFFRNEDFFSFAIESFKADENLLIAPIPIKADKK